MMIDGADSECLSGNAHVCLPTHFSCPEVNFEAKLLDNEVLVVVVFDAEIVATDHEHILLIDLNHFWPHWPSEPCHIAREFLDLTKVLFFINTFI